MIVEFSVKNFRSIKDLQTISFVATKLDSNQEKYPDIDKNNIAEKGGMRLLKTVGIYGANASGKSNIIKAFESFSMAIVAEPRSDSFFLGLLADPFLFQDYPYETESFFQIVFMIDGEKYRYGFTVKNNLQKEANDNSSQIITSEWLYGPKGKNQGQYFIRNGQNIDKKEPLSKENVPKLPYKHSLFLTHSAGYVNGICSRIKNYFYQTGSNYFDKNEGFRHHTINQLKINNEIKTNLLNFLLSFNLSYLDIIIDDEIEYNESKLYPLNKVSMIKHTQKGVRSLNLDFHESEGTKKMFDLAGILLIAFNSRRSGFIVLDELDSNFHPALVIKLIEMFNDPKINKANSQLLFTSHDTNILDPAILRRDQIYFVEKNLDEGTRLYSLSDLKGIRNDADFAKQYLAGFYGAVPILEDYLNKEESND